MANYTQKGYDIAENNMWKGTTEGPNKGYPKNYYYADTLRNISIAFTNFFNDLYVVRYNEYGEPVKNIQVPIKFGPRMKSFDFRRELESGKTYYVSYPNMAWRFDGMSFDAERFSGQYAERVFYNDTLEEIGIDYTMSDLFWGDTQPVPYNLNISMELKCDLLSDATQVVEQICARFTPDVNINIKEFWFFNKKRNISLILSGDPSWSIESESIGEEDKREITVTFSFTAAIWLYKPIKNGVIIDKINTYVSAKNTNATWHQTMFGNYQGKIFDRFDFQDIYNCKVGPNLIQDGDSITTVEEIGDILKWTVSYKYKETDDYRFWPEGSKLPESITTEINIRTKERKVTTKYVENGAYGEAPKNIDIMIGKKQLYDSYGEPYFGYYVKESEELNTPKND